MSLFNDYLKNIKITNLTIVIIFSYLILHVLGQFTQFINTKWIYVIVILYFIIVLRNYSHDFKDELKNIFSNVGLKYVLLIVFANIFFSYGMLYASNYLAVSFPAMDFLVNFAIPLMSLINLPLISTVFISPVAEELIFRGVLLNRLRIYVPTVFAVMISSLLFGSLHSFGSIISAFVFAICMAVLYLKSENICVPILAHFLNNLFAEIIRAVDVNELLFTNEVIMLIVSILAIVSAIILLRIIVKELNNIK